MDNILDNLIQEIPYKWKVQSFNKDKTWGMVVAYIDARDVMDLLDKTVSPQGWQDKYRMEGTRLICSLGIIDEGGNWLWKEDTGSESEGEEEKSLVSDAFKRAAVKWGIGRFLYKKDIKWVEINEYKQPIGDDGKVIYDLSKHINEGGGYKFPFKDKKPQETQKNTELEAFKKDMTYDNYLKLNEADKKRVEIALCKKADVPFMSAEEIKQQLTK